jgi:hypothetical protein
LAGSEPIGDVLSWDSRRRHGYDVRPLADRPAAALPFAEAVTDNTKAGVPEQVQFRLDVPRWLASLKPRDRRVAVRLALGHRTSDVAVRFGLSAARISQLRGALHKSYLKFLAGPTGR